MDIDQDGNVDLFSGCYSRHSSPMAGLFWVLRGNGEQGFAAPAELKGTDGEPLIIEANTDSSGKPRMTDNICTRPFAADLDGDGKLDIVAGNFSGTFAFFKGEGKGRFAPKSTWLEGPNGPLSVNAHSDPCLVDLDGDGDLDIVSGASEGGVFLFENIGSKTEPKFGPRSTLVTPSRRTSGLVLGDSHIQGPQGSTRVWVDDVDGDGKLDLLVGDSVRLEFPVGDLDEKTIRAKEAAWVERRNELMKAMSDPKGGEEKAAQARDEYTNHYKKRSEFLRTDATGFVWVYYQR